MKLSECYCQPTGDGFFCCPLHDDGAPSDQWDQLGDIVARVTLDVDRRLDADLATAIREIGARNDPSEFGPMSARCDCHVCRPPDLAAGVRFPRT